jgi:hypothetical protein
MQTEPAKTETDDLQATLAVNRTRRFADWLIAREEAKQNAEPTDPMMKMLRINTFLTALVLLAIGGADYDAQVMSLIWFI